MALKRIPPKEESEDWMTTYADSVTLLMCFFVMLLSMAKFDVAAFEEASQAIKNQVNKTDDASPLATLKIDVQDIVFGMQADQVVSVGSDDRGVVIELASNAFFKPGSAEIREEAAPVLQKMAQTLKAPRYEFYVMEVEGHTDDIPIKTERFPSNWELSAGRASSVVRYLASQEIDARKFKAVGFAETRPKAPHRDAQGKSIPDNQVLNRRVNIRVSPMSYEERKMFAKKIEVESMEKKPAAPTTTPPAATPPAAQPSAAAPPAAQPATAQPAAPAPAQPRPQAATTGTAAPARTTPAK